MGLLRVRHDTASAAVVRDHISEDLVARSITQDSVADVLLVATELIGNAVVHATNVGDLDVGWDVRDGSVIIRVNDGSPSDPLPRRADASATSGRGLAIVAALADEWGVNHVAKGKQVWARVPVFHAI
ncbi:ATP-binding protein [uncultured Jatrophihabitans sp.]|uniref:ATP-binding protein n=1 Tax=uncultured Jatrophihabitans sp. TaxID=1610747 RepID=UPI0035CB2062